MKTLQIILKSVAEINAKLAVISDVQPDLILVFGALSCFQRQELAEAVHQLAPNATIAGCSTAGEIAVDRVYDNTCVISAIKFDKIKAIGISTRLTGMNDSFDAGVRLAKNFNPNELSAVIIFGVGVNINGSGLVAGWMPFGPRRKVTKSFGLTLAGDIDANGYLKLMHSSTEKLIAGAETAAMHAMDSLTKNLVDDPLAILISCVGRKLVVGDRVDEEVEAVAEMLGKNVCVTGFYSNGEIAGDKFLDECHLHNQTMTITYMTET